MNVSDNSGGIYARCIKILGSSSCNHTNIGDTLIVTLKQVTLHRKVSKHSVCRSILIRQNRKTLRKNGVSLSFFINSIVLVKKKQNEPIGNRIRGSILQELRYKKCMKLLLLS